MNAAISSTVINSPDDQARANAADSPAPASTGSHRAPTALEEPLCRAEKPARSAPVVLGGSRSAESGEGVGQQVAFPGSMARGEGLPPQADCGVDVAEPQLDRPQVARF